MSRSGYSDDYDGWGLICWRGAVASAIRGRRGQAFLREMLAALDKLQRPELIAEDLERQGAVCALGAVGRARALPLTELDPNDSDSVAGAFGISSALAREIVFLNDEGAYRETPRARWERMRGWCLENLRS